MTGNLVLAWNRRGIGTPNGYGTDFGVTDDGRTLLIEVNDGYALGSYGLYYLDYAKLLSAIWAELTGTEDECDFTGERFDGNSW